MKALVYHAIEDVRCDEVPEPELLEPGDVLVKVLAAAICGSDLHPYFGREYGLDPGTIMGHEFAGEIVAVGSGVANYHTGEWVTSPFTTNCGSCYYCLRGLTCRCVKGQLFGWLEQGRGLQGSQAEYVRVPMADATLMRLPQGMDVQTGLLLGDILPTGYHTALAADIDPQGSYAVVGCGPVGLMAVLSAIELGAQTVFALDSVPERLATAAQFGAIPVNIREHDAIAYIKDQTEGRGVDGVLELVGSAAAAELAFALLRSGGTLSVAGVHTAPSFPFSPADAYNKNLTYKVGRCPARSLMDRLVPLAEKMSSHLQDLISHRLCLEEGPRGYQIFANKQEGCTKVILLPHGSP